MGIKMNWKWPQAKVNPRFNSWYTIIRRLVFWVPLVITMTILIILVACSFGVVKAQRVWELLTD